MNTSRRTFIARSSMWLAALGVAPATRMELIDKWGRKLGILDNPLYANELSSNQSQFVIEIVARAGFPFSSFVAPKVDMNMGRVASCSTDNTPEGRLARRAAVHLPQDVREFAGTAPGTNLYLSPFASELFPLVESGALNIAGCQAIQTNGGHAPNFSTRTGVTNSNNMTVAGGAPCPTIHFTSIMPKSTILRGVEWKQNDDATYNNAPSGFTALTRIGGGTGQQSVSGTPLSQQARNFLGLFTPASIPFSTSEAQMIAAATDKMNKNYITYRAMQNSDQIVATALQGFDLLTKDFSAELIPTMSQYTDWNMAEARGALRMSEAMFMLVKAFSLGLIRGATLTFDSGDWHGRLGGVDLSNPMFDPETTTYARDVRHMANAIAKAYTLASSLANPHVPGKSVADGLVVQMTSEFSRTWMHNDCNDHGDGGTNFIGIIGPTVKNITASNFSHQTGATVSVDRTTGQLDLSAPTFSSGSAYATLCQSLGIPAASISAYTSEPSILAMLK